MVDGRNVYVTDHLGRAEQVEARWDPTPASQAELSRNTYQQGVAGRADRLPEDVGGHLIAASGGGPGEGINLVALDTFINGGGGDCGKMEQQIRDIAARHSGAQIELVIDLQHPGDSRRPGRITIDVLADATQQER